MHHERTAPDEAITRWVPLVVGVSVATGVVVRFVAHRGLWLDEALGVNIARLPLGRLVSALRSDGHPPLSYVLLHAWIVVFGHSDFAVRAFAGVVAVATLPLAWLAGKRIGGTRAGLSALFVFSWSPFLVRYATEARMYSLVTFFALALWMLTQDAIAEPRVSRLVGVAVLITFLLLTHYWTIWLLAAGGLLLLGQAVRDHTVARLRPLALASAAGIVLFLPWLPVMVDQLRYTGTPWGRTRSPFSVAAVTVNALGGSLDSDHGARMFEGQIHGLVIIVLLTLAVALGIAGARHAVSLAGVTLLLGAAGCALSGSAFAARYASVAVPFLLLAAAAGLACQRGVVLAAFVGLIVVGGVLYVRRNVTEARSQVPALAAIINHDGAAGDIVVTCPDQLGPSAERVLHPAFDIVPYPAAGDPRFVDWRDYAKRNAAADPNLFAQIVLKRAAGRTLWLVTRGGYRTLGNQCERLQAALGAARSPVLVQDVSVGRVSNEFAALVRYASP